MNKAVPIIVVLALAVIAAFVILLPSSSAGGNSGMVALQITDPAQVPAGTSALVIAYSSLAVQLSNAGSESGWVSANGSGSINLLAVLNLSQTIGTVSVPANASIEMVRFNVTSASITVNGTTHNVTVPSGSVTAHIIGRTTLNRNASVLVDLSPVVASIITNTSTVFVLVPSVRAVVVGGGSNSATLHVGARADLTENDSTELEMARANVSVTSASLSTSPGNVTNFSITLRDNSNTSVVIKHVGFKGNLSIQYNSSALVAMANAFIANMTRRISNSTFCTLLNGNASSHANLSSSQMDNIMMELQDSSFGSQIPNFGISVGEGETVRINASICTPAGLANFTSRLQQFVLNHSTEIQAEQQQRQIMIFSVQSNGTLSVPLGTEDFENSSQSYTLQPGKSATLSFSGVISFGHGMFKITPVAGSVYEVGAQIEETGIVFTNVTAT
ncbi:MAG: DUF4382 domain-containing protein [Candidatus Micrarchaeota archaeon]|nr:DUF4382 domain-containing protein [Candidatus Micrarchaeota archaeon]